MWEKERVLCPQGAYSLGNGGKNIVREEELRRREDWWANAAAGLQLGMIKGEAAKGNKEQVSFEKDSEERESDRSSLLRGDGALW